MRKSIIALANYAWHLSRSICLLAMVILAPVVFVNIVLRYFFGYSLGWSSEVARYAFIWLTFMGMAVALKEDSHAKIELVINLVPQRLQRHIQISGYLLIIALSIILVVAGLLQVISIWGVKAAYMRFLSMGWMYLSIPLSGVFMLLFAMEKIFVIWENGNDTPGVVQ